jgi:hypothetical protein
MARRLSALALLLLGGCLGLERDPTLVKPGPFGTVARRSPVRADVAAAAEAEGKRVLGVGQKIIDANPQIGLRPMFVTVGAPQPEIFHQGGDGPGKPCQVFVSDGLTRLCKTDGELAAVLCVELGKVVAEREALAQPGVRKPAPALPLSERIGPDDHGPFGAGDGTHLAELARWEQQNGRAGKAAPVPAPQVLAQGYLRRAGFAPAELDHVAAVLRQAEDHSDLEKGFQRRPTP